MSWQRMFLLIYTIPHEQNNNISTLVVQRTYDLIMLPNVAFSWASVSVQ